MYIVSTCIQFYLELNLKNEQREEYRIIPKRCGGFPLSVFSLIRPQFTFCPNNRGVLCIILETFL